MSVVLHGDLTQVSLASILQLIDAECVTGRLALQPAGEVWVLEGQPLDATLPPQRGLDALMGLFLAPLTGFDLHQEPAPAGQPLGPMTPLVLSALRVSDEWSRLGPMVLRPAPGAQPALPSGLAGALDGSCTLAEAVALQGLPPSRVVDPVLDALEARALVQAAPPDPERARAAAAPPRPEEFFELIDQGRVELRAGRLAQAEVAFRRALLARPGERLAEQNLRRVLQLKQERQR